MELEPYQKSFIENWGNMGQRWGIGRADALVHGLLYIAPRELDAEEIGATLGMARSNLSGALRRLEDWGLIYKENRMGERRAYYRAETDVWTMAQRIIAERKKREADGALRSVDECLAAARATGDHCTVERMEAMRGLIGSACHCADLALATSPGLLRRVVLAAGTFFRWAKRG